jgi:hypothetical protein
MMDAVMKATVQPAHHSYVVREGGRGLTHIAARVGGFGGPILRVPFCRLDDGGRWHFLPGGVVLTCQRCRAIRAAERGDRAVRGGRRA